MNTPALAPQPAGPQFTPGPWHFFARQRPRRSNFEAKFGAVYVGHVGAGSGMDSVDICDLKGTNEVLANARLIAAAPELLAALQALTKFGECAAVLLPAHGYDNTIALLDKAHAAIDKAMKGTP